MTKEETVTVLANITQLLAKYPLATQLEIRAKYHEQYGRLYSHAWINDLIHKVRDATHTRCVEIRDHDYRIIAARELDQVTALIDKVRDAYDAAIAGAESDHAARWYSQYLGLCGRRQEILEDMLIYSVDTAGAAVVDKDTVGGADGPVEKNEKPELIAAAG